MVVETKHVPAKRWLISRCKEKLRNEIIMAKLIKASVVTHVHRLSLLKGEAQKVSTGYAKDKGFLSFSRGFSR